jgi:hypothetical protein
MNVRAELSVFGLVRDGGQRQNKNCGREAGERLQHDDLQNRD